MHVAGICFIRTSKLIDKHLIHIFYFYSYNYIHSINKLKNLKSYKKDEIRREKKRKRSGSYISM